MLQRELPQPLERSTSTSVHSPVLRAIPHTALSASCVSSLRSGLRLRLRLRLRSSISETDTEPVCATPVHLLVDAEPRATDQVFSK